MSFWAGKRVLVTGHTGFKGAWLSLWLTEAGADVTGLALEAQPRSLFDAARLAADVRHVVGDIRHAEVVGSAMAEARPDVVLHLAAEAIVRRSLSAPVATYATNVMGTVNVLEAVRAAQPRVALVVTSDKCYENREWVWGYREHEPLGGKDPYSSSKACAELVTAAYRASFFDADGPRIATARAGNVIGGGDRGEDRLIPDFMRAVELGQPLRVRHPAAIRPWQHVLNPLEGYLRLAERLWHDPSVAAAYNFGPDEESARDVAWIADRICERWGAEARWEASPGPHPPEAMTLRLDSSLARTTLDWRPRWDLETALDRIVGWHRAHAGGEDARALCASDLAAFVS